MPQRAVTHETLEGMPKLDVAALREITKISISIRCCSPVQCLLAHGLASRTPHVFRRPLIRGREHGLYAFELGVNMEPQPQPQPQPLAGERTASTPSVGIHAGQGEVPVRKLLSLLALAIGITVVAGFATTQSSGCMSVQEREESDKKIDALTAPFDVASMEAAETEARKEQAVAVDAYERCLSGATPFLVSRQGCQSEFQRMDTAAMKYNSAATQLGKYRKLAELQATQRSLQRSVCQ